MMKSLLLLIISFLLSKTFFKNGRVNGASVENENNIEIGKKIDTFVKTVLDCNDPPALTMAVVKDGQVILSKGYGYTTADKSTKTTETTRFAIGSLTKAFTTLLLAKAIDERSNITMDTPISTYIKDFQLVDDYISKTATLRDLLSHRTSVPAYITPLMLGYDPNLTRKGFVSNMKYMQSPNTFRDKFIYNNYMYILAGDVLEQLSKGESWENLVQNTIFRPLGMDDSGFVDNVTDFSNFALPAYVSNGSITDLDPELFKTAHIGGPAGTIFSTADDMTKWMKLILSKDKSNPLRLDPNVIQTTFEPSMLLKRYSHVSKPSSPISQITLGYCLGWIKAMYREYDQMYHTGGIVTHSSRLWIYPELNTGIFMSGNGGTRKGKRNLFRVVMYYASDLLIGLEPWFNSSDSRICPPRTPFPFPPRNRNSSSYTKTTCKNCESLALTNYVGNYTHQLFGVATVYLNSSSSQLHLSYGRFGWFELTPKSKYNFTGILTGPISEMYDQGSYSLKIKFSFDEENGPATSLSFRDSNDNYDPFYKESSDPGKNCQLPISASISVCFSVVISVLMNQVLFDN